jgi:hypothetical protein
MGGQPLVHVKEECREDALNVFDGFSENEIKAAIANMFTFLVQRGCIQRCPGCHAGARGVTFTSSWDDTIAMLKAINAAMDKYGVQINAHHIEPFRDSDPAHLRIDTPDGPKGLGDLAEAFYAFLGKKTKFMTSGIVENIKGNPPEFMYEQLRKAAPYLSSASVSCSIDTVTYRMDPDQCSTVLARTLDEIIQSVRSHNSNTPIYLDVMFYSKDRKDERTQKTLALLKEVAQKSELFDHTLVHHAEETIINGAENQKWVGNNNIGLRVSPFLNLFTQKGKQLDQGIDLDDVKISDWLGVQQSIGTEPFEYETVDGETFSEELLRTNLDARQRFISTLQNAALSTSSGYLGDASKGSERIVRSEFDLTANTRLRVGEEVRKYGPHVNLLISNPEKGEIQDPIPFRGLTLPSQSAGYDGNDQLVQLDLPKDS